MGSRYLTDMANVLRAAGLRVVEQNGWQTRARRSGGYESGQPWCVMWHHTAGNGLNPVGDTAYMSYSAAAKPIANLYIARNGDVWVLAAGATNTNGVGNALKFSRGTVPANSMNSYAVGMEIANTGVGQPYPTEQIEACFKTSLALTSWLGLQPDDVAEHVLYSPGRKIDPSRAESVQGGWKPRSINSSGSWNTDDLRAECRRRATKPKPQPSTGDTVIRILASHTDPPEFNAVFFAECDSQGRSIEVQWTGDGNDPRVQQRLQTMQENFGSGPGIYGSYHVGLAGLINNRLHPKHKPSDINDSLHTWTENDFAP